MTIPTVQELLAPMIAPPWMEARAANAMNEGFPQHVLALASAARLWPLSEATRVYGSTAVRMIGSPLDPLVRARAWWASLPRELRESVFDCVRAQVGSMLFDLGDLISNQGRTLSADETAVLNARVVAWALQRDDLQSFDCLIHEDNAMQAALRAHTKQIDDLARSWLSTALVRARAFEHPQIHAGQSASDGPFWWAARAPFLPPQGAVPQNNNAV